MAETTRHSRSRYGPTRTQLEIKPLLTLAVALATLACSVGSGCGSGGRPSSNSDLASTPTTRDARSGGFVPRAFGDYDTDDYYNDSHHSDADNDDSKPSDRDNDSDNPTHSYFDGDDNEDRRYGHAASAPDRRAVAALVKRFYAAASSGDGATGCSLIYSTLASSVAETLGGSGGPGFLRGKTCHEVMSKAFRENHAQVSAYAALLQLSGVRLQGNHGLVIMAFEGLPGRVIAIEREHGAWKIDSLLDHELP